MINCTLYNWIPACAGMTVLSKYSLWMIRRIVIPNRRDDHKDVGGRITPGAVTEGSCS